MVNQFNSPVTFLFYSSGDPDPRSIHPVIMFAYGDQALSVKTLLMKTRVDTTS